jgi:bacteriocin-like protein
MRVCPETATSRAAPCALNPVAVRRDYPEAGSVRRRPQDRQRHGNLQEETPMASKAKQDSEPKRMSAQKPKATKKELSEKELEKVSGGFNPQPDPPARHR